MTRLVVGTSKNQIRVLSLSNYEGSVETNVDEWIDHLSATLFATNTNTVYRIWGAPQIRVGPVPSNRLQNPGQPLLPPAMLEVWAVRLRRI